MSDETVKSIEKNKEKTVRVTRLQFQPRQGRIAVRRHDTGKKAFYKCDKQPPYTFEVNENLLNEK